LVEYRLSISKQPTLRLYRVDGHNRRPLAEVTGRKAELAQKILLGAINSEDFIRFRDGRVVKKIDEESALKVAIGLRAIIGLRAGDRVIKALEAVNSMDRGEVYWWHSLYLRMGDKAIRALRTAYV
jgi:hypothetical protein